MFYDALHPMLSAYHGVLFGADWVGEGGEDGADRRPVCLGLPVTSLPRQEGQQGLPQYPQVSRPYAVPDSHPTPAQNLCQNAMSCVLHGLNTVGLLLRVLFCGLLFLCAAQLVHCWSTEQQTAVQTAGYATLHCCYAVQGAVLWPAVPVRQRVEEAAGQALLQPLLQGHPLRQDAGCAAQGVLHCGAVPAPGGQGRRRPHEAQALHPG